MRKQRNNSKPLQREPRFHVSIITSLSNPIYV